MAKKSIFISSPTRNHLGEYRRRLAEEIEKHFELNVVRSDNGDINYGAELTREMDCINSIKDDSITIFVSIIETEFGSTSDYDQNHSISMRELIEAKKCKKIIYVFVNDKIKNTYETFKQNGFNYSVVEGTNIDKRILFFLKDHVYETEIRKRLIIDDYNDFDEVIIKLKKSFCNKLHNEILSEYQKKQASFSSLADQITRVKELTQEDIHDFIFELLKISNFLYPEIIQKNDFFIILSEITIICSQLLKCNEGLHKSPEVEIDKKYLKEKLTNLTIELIKMDIKQ